MEFLLSCDFRRGVHALGRSISMGRHVCMYKRTKNEYSNAYERGVTILKGDRLLHECLFHCLGKENLFGMATENDASLRKTSSLYDRSLARHLVRTRPLPVLYIWRGLRAIAAYTLVSGDVASSGEVGPA